MVNSNVKNALFKMLSKSKRPSSEGNQRKRRKKKLKQALLYQILTATSVSVASQLQNGRITVTRHQAVTRVAYKEQIHKRDV